MNARADWPHFALRPLLPALAVPLLIGALSGAQLLLWPEGPTLGVIPRWGLGLIGVVTAPFFHADATHLSSNLIALLLLLPVSAQLYPSFWRASLAWVWLGGHSLVWLLARPGNHAGASGLVFGLTGLLIVSGLLRRERGAMTAALLALFLNQGLVWGMLPVHRDVSWEAHVYAFVVGAVAAWVWRHDDVPPNEDSEEEAHEINPTPRADADPTRGLWDYQRHLPPDQRDPTP